MNIKKFQNMPLIIILLSCTLIKVYAQDHTMRPTKKNHFYLELGGNGGLYSFNYERLITDNFTLRAGFGITPGILFVDGTFLAIPLTASYLAGSDAHKFEAGFGTTFFTVQDPEVFGFPVEVNSFFALTGIIGYRYFKPRGGFTFRICFTPFYNTGENEFAPSGGLSFGLGF